MSVPDETPHVAAPDDPQTGADVDHPVMLEEDETIAPRPEEEIADLLRAEPGDDPRPG